MDAINWHSFFFLLFALIACVFAVAVLLTSNVVRMASYLIVSLASVAILFFLAGADLVGVMQLMIYVGGTLVLLIFGVMLTARGPFVSMKTNAGDWLTALFIGGALLAVLLHAAFSIDAWLGPPPGAMANSVDSQPPTATRLGLGLVGVRVDRLEANNVSLRGGMSGYLLPFEIISIHLLVVLIGAAYLARTKLRKKTGKKQSRSSDTTRRSPDTQ